jgi:muramidase (phage lysozyme)
MIRSSEHLARDVASGADYSTFFGGGRFTNFADHPVNTGELKGVPLKPEWCRAAGFPGGKCVSTAAGAYQFTRPTWNELRGAGAWGGRLPDFSPASQDEAARRLLRRIGALPLIERGEIPEAILTAAGRWASLPGSTSGQPQKSMEFALRKFNEGVGVA